MLMKALLGFMKTSSTAIPSSLPLFSLFHISTHFLILLSQFKFQFQTLLPPRVEVEVRPDMSDASVNHIKGSKGSGRGLRIGGSSERGWWRVHCGSSTLNLCGFWLVCFVSTFFFFPPHTRQFCFRFARFVVCLLRCESFDPPPLRQPQP